MSARPRRVNANHHPADILKSATRPRRSAAEMEEAHRVKELEAQALQAKLNATRQRITELAASTKEQVSTRAAQSSQPLDTSRLTPKAQAQLGGNRRGGKNQPHVPFDDDHAPQPMVIDNVDLASVIGNATKEELAQFASLVLARSQGGSPMLKRKGETQNTESDSGNTSAISTHREAKKAKPTHPSGVRTGWTPGAENAVMKLNATNTQRESLPSQAGGIIALHALSAPAVEDPTEALEDFETEDDDQTRETNIAATSNVRTTNQSAVQIVLPGRPTNIAIAKDELPATTIGPENKAPSKPAGKKSRNRHNAKDLDGVLSDPVDLHRFSNAFLRACVRTLGNLSDGGFSNDRVGQSLQLIWDDMFPETQFNITPRTVIYNLSTRHLSNFRHTVGKAGEEIVDEYMQSEELTSHEDRAARARWALTDDLWPYRYKSVRANGESPREIKYIGPFQSEIVLRVFSRFLYKAGVGADELIESKSWPVNALVLSLVSIERAFGLWTRGIKDRASDKKLSAFSGHNWSSKAKRHILKSLNYITDKIWEDILRGAEVYVKKPVETPTGAGEEEYESNNEDNASPPPYFDDSDSCEEL